MLLAVVDDEQVMSLDLGSGHWTALATSDMTPPLRSVGVAGTRAVVAGLRHVRVYAHVDGAWAATATLSVETGVGGVAVQGALLAVGVPAFHRNLGRYYLYRFSSGGQPTPLCHFDNTDPNITHSFGATLAVEDHDGLVRVVAGTPGGVHVSEYDAAAQICRPAEHVCRALAEGSDGGGWRGRQRNGGTGIGRGSEPRAARRLKCACPTRL